MLDNSTAKNDHAGALGLHGYFIDPLNVFDNVDTQLLWRALESMEEEHIAKTSVSESRAENGYVVFVGPVINRPLIVDFLTEPMDDFAGSPDDGFVVVLGGLLLFQQLVENRDDPVLEGAVIVVGNKKVANTIHALCSKSCTRRCE